MNKTIRAPQGAEGSGVPTSHAEIVDARNESSPAISSTPRLTAVSGSPPSSAAENRLLPQSLVNPDDLVRAQDGLIYVVMHDRKNLYVVVLGGTEWSSILRRETERRAIKANDYDLNRITESLRAHAYSNARHASVFSRVAPVENGIEIDIGDTDHTRVRISAGKVEVIESESTALFLRRPMSLPLCRPADNGDIAWLRCNLNIHPVLLMLLLGWITYTIAHPKTDTTKYVILIVVASQGSGKSFLSRVLKDLIDPSRVGVQMFPYTPKDLALDAQNNHLLIYDNIRAIKRHMSDALCIASTGGSITNRQLYSDADLRMHSLHGAIVLNGIHHAVTESDLAQRCLPIELLPIQESRRRTEAELMAEFSRAKPTILRGLYDLIAKILSHLPSAEIESPERMLDFVRWLAAMELAMDIPPGSLQHEFSAAVHQGQLESLQDDLLGSTLMEFIADEPSLQWRGTPTELLSKLSFRVSQEARRSRAWPQNPIAMSKRLVPLIASLSSQGIEVIFERGKQRTITIKGNSK